MALIHELLPKVMADIGEIGKGQTNRHQGYNFRGVDDVLNACGPVFAKHGVCLSPKVTTHSVTAGVMQTKQGDKPRYHAVLQFSLTLFASDGSSVEFCTAGEAFSIDGDKATAAAMSNAYKYALFLGLCIPVARECIVDQDRNSDEDNERHNENDSPQRRPLPSRQQSATNGTRKNKPPGDDRPAFVRTNCTDEEANDMAEIFSERIGQAVSESELQAIADEIKGVFADDRDPFRRTLAAPYAARLMFIRKQQASHT